MKRVFLSMVCLLAGVGCAHREDVHVDSVTEVSQRDREVIAVELPAEPPPQAPPQESAATRPRLSHVVVLGEGTNSQYEYVPMPPPDSRPRGPSTVVNNYYVEGAGPRGGYYGGYGGYGYGGYGSYGYGSRGFVEGRGATGARTAPQWGATGWEGAGRTAAPGHTPNIGGNWPRVPSYGPAPMR